VGRIVKAVGEGGALMVGSFRVTDNAAAERWLGKKLGVRECGTRKLNRKKKKTDRDR